MKVSYDILQKFVTPPKKLTPRLLADALTMSVVEVDGYEDQAERLQHLVVGMVTKVEPHPNADKLKLAEVDCGKEKFDVVCGGVNLRVGMRVAFAKVGARVRWHGQGDWVILAAAKIRGAFSHGMICAAEELELPDAAAVEHGIMDLSHLSAKAGTPLSEALGLSDIILDIDNKSITHRPDLWGHFGLARELAALWGAKLHEPASPELKPEIDVPFMVSSKAGSAVQRYLGVAVVGVKVAPSPAWLAQALHSLGMRPINNVVDVTNYVMAELGQPLHAFDLEKLASPEIVVRYAKKGEQLAMLDGVTRELDGETLVIADKKKALAVAGVMGGQGSGVSESTTSIVLESAAFEPVGVRLTAARLGLRTEASARFEKALDPVLAELALRRTVALLHEVCPSAHVASPVVDVYPKPPEPRTISLSLPWLYKRLGVEVSAKEVLDILGRLGFAVEEKKGELAVTVPSWRATRDITIPEDLVEEVARIYGYGKIPLTMPEFAIVPPPRDESQELRWKIRDLLVGAGWTETLSYSFFRLGQKQEQSLELVNPVDQTKRWLRTTVYDTLHDQFEAARRADEGRSLKLFELGRVFTSEIGKWSSGESSKAKLPAQPWHLALAAFDPKYDSLGAVKGTIKLLEESLGVSLPREGPPHVFPRGGALIEVNLSIVQSAEARVFKPIPKYPSVMRDLSIVLPPNATWDSIENHVRSASPLIESIEVFDVYAEKGSVAFHLTFRSAERTLKSEEVDAVIAGLTQSLQQIFGATARS